MSASTVDAKSPVAPIGVGEAFRAVSLPVLAGLFVRAIPVITTDFPLNDGGLFLAMTRDLQNANFLLPATTSYNGLDIPYAYPPLGFYVAGLLSSVLGIGLLDLFRFLPLLFATLIIPVVYLVARELLTSRFQALLATWAFAFIPRSFDWLILGGGLTRSLGMLFAILTVLEGVRYFKSGQTRHAGALVVLAALTLVSHPQAAVFAGLSVVLILLSYARTWRALGKSIALAAVTLLIAAPWWVSVVMTHGIAPFVSGGQTGANLAVTFQRLATFTFTDEPYATVFAVLGLIGLIQLVATRRYLLPALVMVVFTLDPRGAATELMMPFALLTAVAVDEVLLARIPRTAGDLDVRLLWPTAVVRDRFGRLVLGIGLLLGVVGAIKAPTALGSPLQALSGPNRTVMAWIQTNAPPSTPFVVASGNVWFLDSNSEWFPVLTGRRSIATVQGFEWLGKTQWEGQMNRYDSLQMCVRSGVDCLSDWMSSEKAFDAWVYVPVAPNVFSPGVDCCEALRLSLAASRDFEVAYQGPGGAVFRPR